jgi:hypothetical protein
MNWACFESDLHHGDENCGAEDDSILAMALDECKVSYSPIEFNRFIAARSILGPALPD